MQKRTDNENSSEQLTAYKLGRFTRKKDKPAQYADAGYSMPAAFFFDSFLKGCGVLFGFVQTPGFSGRK